MNNQPESIHVGPATAELAAMLVTEQSPTDVNPTPASDQFPALPDLDAIVAPYKRADGVKGRMSGSEKQAQADVNARRALAQGICEELAEARQLLREARSANAKLRGRIVEQAGELQVANAKIDDATKLLDANNGMIARFMGTAETSVYLASEVSAAVQEAASEIELTPDLCAWTVGDVDLSCTQNQVNIGGNSTDSVTLEIGPGRRLTDRQRAIIFPFFATGPSTDPSDATEMSTDLPRIVMGLRVPVSQFGLPDLSGLNLDHLPGPYGG